MYKAYRHMGGCMGIQTYGGIQIYGGMYRSMGSILMYEGMKRCIGHTDIWEEVWGIQTYRGYT